MRAILSLLPIWLFLPFGVTSHACQPIPFEEPIFPDFYEGDSVFVGTLIDFEIAKVRNGQHQFGVARLTYRVDEVLSGEFGQQVQLSWSGNNFDGIPANHIQTWDQEIIGARREDIFKVLVPLEGKSSSPSFFGEIPILALHPCDNVGNLPATRKNIATVKNWIETGQKVRFGEVERFGTARIEVPARPYEDPKSIEGHLEKNDPPPMPLQQWAFLLGLPLLLAGVSYLTWRARRS